tara:strand:+ start:1026 stop:1319 length:294 start_codon:yes stop_codon:yes gene_type:complete
MIKSIVVFEKELALKLSDGSDLFVNLADLRKACPCAGCSGETDVFGNTYIGENKKLVLDAFKVVKYSFVGLYGVRFFWGDGHRDGIYTFDLLKSLNK